MSTNEIRQAFRTVVVQGILDWKMPLFQGIVLVLSAVAVTVTAGVQDYKAMTDIDDLTWFKITWTAVASACTALISFLNGSFHRARQEIKSREEANATPTTDTLPPP